VNKCFLYANIKFSLLMLSLKMYNLISFKNSWHKIFVGALFFNCINFNAPVVLKNYFKVNLNQTSRERLKFYIFGHVFSMMCLFSSQTVSPLGHECFHSKQPVFIPINVPTYFEREEGKYMAGKGDVVNWEVYNILII
jgi:hypothetical protein